MTEFYQLPNSKISDIGESLKNISDDKNLPAKRVDNNCPWFVEIFTDKNAS